MKKVFVFAAIAALVVSTITSCQWLNGGNNNNNNNENDEPVILEEPAKAANAIKIELTDVTPVDPGTEPGTGEQPAAQPYKEFEATEGGTFLINEVVKDDDGNEKEIYHSGPYTVVNKADGGIIYDCEGFGEVELVPRTSAARRYDIIFRPRNKAPVSASGTEVPTPPANTNNNSMTNIARTWTIDKTIISVSGGSASAGLGVAHPFTGLKVSEIVNYLNENGININKDLSGYNVTTVDFSKSNSIIFNFSGADPYVGTFTITSDNKITYDFSATSGDIPVINGSAIGTADFKNLDKPTDPAKCELTLTSTLDNNGTKYSAKVILNMTEKK